MSSRCTTVSASPCEKAIPALVVASAEKPKCRRYRAEPISHGFGITKHPLPSSITDENGGVVACTICELRFARISCTPFNHCTQEEGEMDSRIRTTVIL